MVHTSDCLAAMLRAVKQVGRPCHGRFVRWPMSLQHDVPQGESCEQGDALAPALPALAQHEALLANRPRTARASQSQRYAGDP